MSDEPPEVSETNEQRAERASRLLEQRVRRETIVDTRLDGHDRRLAAINGQLERGARATELVGERLHTLEQAVVNLRTDLSTKARVDEALKAKAEQAVAQQITRREFWMGVAVIVVAVVSVAINSHLFG